VGVNGTRPLRSGPKVLIFWRRNLIGLTPLVADDDSAESQEASTGNLP